MEPEDEDDIDSLREEHRSRIFDLYQRKASNVQIMLGIIIGFTLVFFFLIFLPFTSDLKAIKELEQDISSTSILLNQTETNVNRYNDVYGGIKQVNSELGKFPLELENFVTKILEQDNSDKIQYKNTSSYLTNFSQPEYTELITNENHTYVIFVENTNLRFMAFDRSDNKTQSYTVSNASGRILNTDIAMNNSDVFVLWEGEISSDNPEEKIFFAKGTDNGNTFKPTISMGNVTPPVDNLKLIPSANNIYAMWKSYSHQYPEGHKIFFTRSTDDGSSFEPVKEIANGTSFDVAVSNNNIYVVSTATNVQNNSMHIYFTQSTDYGKTFKPVDIIYNDTVANTKEHDKSISDFAVDAQDSNAYIVWSKTGQNQTGSKISSIFFKKSNNNGNSFEPVKRIENVSKQIMNLEIKSFENNVYISSDSTVWNDTAVGSTSSPIPLHFDVSMKISFDHGRSFIDKNSIVKSNSFPMVSQLFVQPYEVIVLSIRGNDILKSESGASGHDPFYTTIFTNATDIDFLSGYGNGPDTIGFNSGGKVYGISGNTTGIRLNIFSPTYGLDIFSPTYDLNERAYNLCPTVSATDPSSYSAFFQCNVKTHANNLLKTFEPKIQKNIISPLELINSNNSNISRLSSDIHSDLKGFTQLFDRVLAKEYPLLLTIDGRVELKGKLTNESSQFWMQYESKIENETQLLKSKINSLNNETKILSDEKAQLIKHQNEIVDRLQHIRLPIGEIPIGFTETMAVFPLIMSGGLLILALMLVDSINIRKAFHLLSLKKDPTRKLFSNQQISLSLPLWIDPISPRIVQALKFLVLSIPLIFFILSCYTIFSVNVESTFPKFTENVQNNNLIYIGAYAVSSTFFVYGYYQLVKVVHQYRCELKSKSKLD